MQQYTKEHILHLLPLHLPQFAGKQLCIQQTPGMTNHTYKVSAGSVAPVIFSILSSTIDWKYGLQVLQNLHSSNICPKTLYACESYRIDEYIEEARHPAPQQINQNDELLTKVLGKLYQLHEIKLPKQLQKSFLGTVVFGEKNKKRCLNSFCRQPQREAEFNQLKQGILCQNSKLEKKIQKHFESNSHSFKLAHNDAHLKNILIKNTHPPAKEEVFLIDLDYTCYNYVAYDIATVLAQCCYEYIDKMPGFRVFKTVTSQQIKRACDLYPGKYEGLEDDVLMMLAACNYFYAFWSVMAPPIAGFSVIDHGIARFEMYKYYIKQWELK